MPEIKRNVTCNAPLAVAFEYVADYRNIPDWMFGVQQIEPVGAADRGSGAMFEVTVHLGVRLHNRIQAVEWEPDRLIGMDAVGGPDFRSRWWFAADGQDRTTITADVRYTLPGGLAGRAMGRIVQPVVGQAVNHASHSLVRNIESVVGQG